MKGWCKCIVWLVLMVSLPVLGDESAEPIEPVDVAVYGELPGIEHVALSLSGKYISLVTQLKDQRILLVAEVGGEILHRIRLGDIKLRDLDWAGDDHVIVRTSSTVNLGFEYGGRYELFNLMTLKRGSGEMDWPLANSKKVLNAAFSYYPPVLKGGHWHQCIGTLPLRHSTLSDAAWITDFELELTCIDLDEGRFHRIERGRDDGDGWLVGTGIEVLARASYDQQKQRWRLWAGAEGSTLTKRVEPIREFKSRYGSYNIVGQGRRKGTVIYAVNRQHLVEVPLSGEEGVELYDNAIIGNLHFDPVTGLHNGYTLLGDIPELVMLDPGLQARVAGTRKAFPNLNVHFKSWSRDMGRIVVYTDGAGDAGTWWIMDIAKGSAEVLGVNYPALKSRHVGATTMLRYQSSDGLPISAVLTYPPGKKDGPYPLLVLPHGGPESRDYLGFDWIAQAFASRGYVVLQPNYRGSDGYGIAFRNAGFGEVGDGMHRDIQAGVAALAERGDIDPERVCILGASFGGYLALAAVTLDKGNYRCAVSVAGVSDPVSDLRNDEMHRAYASQRYWKDYFGVSSSRDDALDALSPLEHAKRASAPILLIHGEDDTVVESRHSKRMARKLKSADKPHKYVELDEEDHYLSRADTRQKMLRVALDFVIKHNPPSGAQP